ncbi:MAG TPA: hypothetical protein IGS52_00750 [Oscillatoriaceae cyanobacterium M33_DOE_052]|uniref:Uncharacterized protein n=1 Tax=Planktothricoides sp. SpSt-374 TaxID=2282167 RepID=A0A7C3VIF0_9CYAN|nr:hypothetical protein [Oscillatoriaceae cyanobacterium M33_DOE_052]
MLPMKPDLQELIITKGECNHITGVNSFLFNSLIGYVLSLDLKTYDQQKPQLQVLAQSGFFKKKASNTIKIFEECKILLAANKDEELIRKIRFDNTFGNWLPLFNQRFLAIIYLLAIVTLGMTLLMIAMYYLPLYIKYLSNKMQYFRLSELLKEVEKHNQIVNNLYTLDQLEAVGNPVKINDRIKVIEALKITRAGLVRALQTERILRENPNFQPQYFNIDLSGVQAERTMVRAVEYAQLLDDAVQIGVSLQQEMRKLQRNR